jgi:hypothetical protein
VNPIRLLAEPFDPFNKVLYIIIVGTWSVPLAFLDDWMEVLRKRFGAGAKVVEVFGEKCVLAAKVPFPVLLAMGTATPEPGRSLRKVVNRVSDLR